jgi:hypothetical protein
MFLCRMGKKVQRIGRNWAEDIQVVMLRCVKHDDTGLLRNLMKRNDYREIHTDCGLVLER